MENYYSINIIYNSKIAGTSKGYEILDNLGFEIPLFPEISDFYERIRIVSHSDLSNKSSLDYKVLKEKFDKVSSIEKWWISKPPLNVKENMKNRISFSGEKK